MFVRSLLYRIHIWLAVFVGIPLLFWTVSGLWMVARPIEEVRGTALKAGLPPLSYTRTPVFPGTGARPATSLELVQQTDGPRWIINFADGAKARANPETGELLPAVAVDEARRLAIAAIKGRRADPQMTRFAADRNPVDLRRERPAWQARFDDGTHVYIDADTGQMLAIRTQQWRVFDWFWGLHIMDIEGREDTHHPILITFAALAAIAVILAMIQLPIVLWRRRRRSLTKT